MTNPMNGPAIFVTALVTAGTMFAFSQPVVAQGQNATITTRGKPIAPIYNPHTKSYFELRIDLPRPPTWTTAVRFARTKFFKRTRGRLAIVKDLDTHSFLRYPQFSESKFRVEGRSLDWPSIFYLIPKTGLGGRHRTPTKRIQNLVKKMVPDQR